MVDVVNAAKTELIDERVTGGAKHRGGADFKVRIQRHMDVSHPESGMNMRCGYSQWIPGPGSPRHRHPFEQVRYILSGTQYYGNRLYGPDTFQYIAEGTWYGPQRIPEGPEPYRQLVFQFPGPSNIYMHKRGEIPAGAEKMRAQGVEFKDGKAHFPDGTVQDGWEAVYEFLTGQKVVYPEKSRFEDPVYMFADQFRWRPTGQDGVAAKHLGYFNDCGPALSLLRLEPGASIPRGASDCIDIRINIQGEVEYEGERLGEVSRIYCPPGATHEEITSQGGATLLVFRLAPPGGTPPALEVL
jgi:hypothetical protein